MELDEIERRMRPGGWYTKPLLLESESLVLTLEEDARRLVRLGVSAEVLGHRLAELLATASTSDWFRPFRGGPFDVELRHRRGLIPCPWAPDETTRCPTGAGGRATANQFAITNRNSRRRLAGFELSAHLIRDHGFFGGRGTAFRIQPEDLALLLGLGSAL
jgi:hypothetical protein